MKPRFSRNQAGQTASTDHVSRAIAFISIFILAFALTFGFFAQFEAVPIAYAGIHSVDEEAESEMAADSSESAEPEEGESIDDEENPMSSGLGGGEPISNDAGFGGIIVVGIVAVAAFFFVLIRKLNGSIRDMNSMFKLR